MQKENLFSFHFRVQVTYLKLRINERRAKGKLVSFSFPSASNLFKVTNKRAQSKRKPFLFYAEGGLFVQVSHSLNFLELQEFRSYRSSDNISEGSLFVSLQWRRPFSMFHLLNWKYCLNSWTTTTWKLNNLLWNRMKNECFLQSDCKDFSWAF